MSTFMDTLRTNPERVAGQSLTDPTPTYTTSDSLVTRHTSGSPVQGAEGWGARGVGEGWGDWSSTVLLNVSKKGFRIADRKSVV